MEADRKAKTARILGYVCVAVGAVNLLLAGVVALQDQTRIGFPLVGTGFGALAIGIIMLSRGRRSPESEG